MCGQEAGSGYHITTTVKTLRMTKARAEDLNDGLIPDCSTLSPALGSVWSFKVSNG